MDYQDRLEEPGYRRVGDRFEGESTKGLAKQLLESAGDLVRAEIMLAKLEAREYADQLTRQLVKVAIAAVLGLGALIALVHFASQVLDVWMADWLAYLIIGVLLAAVAGVLINQASKAIKKIAHPQQIAPRTIQTLQEDKAWLRREMNGDVPRTM